MMNIFLIFESLVLVSILAFLIAGAIYARRIIRRFADFAQDKQEQLTAWITPAEPGAAAPAAQLWDSLSTTLAQRMAAQVKAVLMGTASGAARAEKSIEGDIALAMAEQSPLGGLLDAVPGVKKTLKRNPALLNLALQKLGPVFAGLPGGNTQGPGGAGPWVLPGGSSPDSRYRV